MNSARLQELFKKGTVIFDGAIGTEIYKRNFFVNASFEQLNLTAPGVISEIHREYRNAGCEILTTNTYNGNRSNLMRFGLAEQLSEINQAGVRLAREVAGDELLVAASIGPVKDTNDDNNSLVEQLSEQVASLLEADFILFESLRSLGDLTCVLEVVKKFPDLAYMVSFALNSEGENQYGGGLEEYLHELNNFAGAMPLAIGLNCGSGPDGMLTVVEKLMSLTDLPVVVQPNAGTPKIVDGRSMYMASEEYFTTYALRYHQLGVQGIGGCCGITPAHIRELAAALKPLNAAERQRLPQVVISSPELCEPTPLVERSRFGSKLAKGELLRCVEMTPPRGFDLTGTIAGAKLCEEAGVDAINLPDGPRASARISPLVTAMEIQKSTKLEVVLHVCCRDKSLIGLQADMLGCAWARIRNLLFITGDPPKLGDYPFSSGVFDVDSIGMTRMQSQMNRGVDFGGKKISEPTQAVIGVGADPNAIDPEREYRRLCEKAEAGADFITTQPVFEVAKLLEFMERIKHLNLPVIAGIWPLASLRNAEFMRNEVPGVVVPDEVMLRMSAAATREDQRQVGIDIARESIAALHGRVAGIQVSAPLGNINTALLVLKD